MSWNSDPVVVTVAVTGADVFRDTNPNVPYTAMEIADSAIAAAGAGATIAHLHVREDDGTPSGRPELFVEVIDRIRARLPGPDDGLDRRRQRHDDRRAHDRPRGQAGHLRGRVGLDELRRRDVHHAAPRRPRDRREGAGRGDRAGGRVLRRRPRRQRRALARAGRARAAAAGQPGLRGPGGHRREPRGARGDAPAAARRDVLDGHLHRPPPLPDAGAGAAARGPRCPHRARGCRLYRQGRASPTRTSSSSARLPIWRGRWAARSRPRSRRRSCSGSADGGADDNGSRCRPPPGKARRGHARDDRRRRGRPLRPARLPRGERPGDRRGSGDPAGGDLPLVREQGGAALPPADRLHGPARGARLRGRRGAADAGAEARGRRFASTFTSTACTRRRPSSPTPRFARSGRSAARS